jgi:hypothetical protein
VPPKAEVRDVGDDLFGERRGIDDHRILPARLGDERRDRAEPGVIAATRRHHSETRIFPCRQGKTGKFSRCPARYAAKPIACEQVRAHQQGKFFPCRALGRELAGKRRIRRTASTVRRVSDMFSYGFATHRRNFQLSRLAVSNARVDGSGRPKGGRSLETLSLRDARPRTGGAAQIDLSRRRRHRARTAGFAPIPVIARRHPDRLRWVATCPWHPGFPASVIRSINGPSSTLSRFRA